MGFRGSRQVVPARSLFLEISRHGNRAVVAGSGGIKDRIVRTTHVRILAVGRRKRKNCIRVRFGVRCAIRERSRFGTCLSGLSVSRSPVNVKVHSTGLNNCDKWCGGPLRYLDSPR